MTIAKTCVGFTPPPGQVCNGAGSSVFAWTPDGIVAPANPSLGIPAGAISGGIETLDPFSLNRGVTASANFINEDVISPVTGSFAARTNQLGAGRYTMTILQTARSNATIEVPEPGTLALVGLSLVGLAAVGRRRSVRQAA